MTPNQIARFVVRFVVLLLLAAALFAVIFFVVPEILLPAFRRNIPIP